MLSPVCLDRKQGSLTSDLGPLCGCVCLSLRTGSFRGGFDGQMVLVAVAVGTGARRRDPAERAGPRGASGRGGREGGGGVYDPRCQRAAKQHPSHEVRGTTAARRERRGRMKECGRTDERSLDPEFSAAAPHWTTERAVKSLFHSSVNLTHK